MGLYFRLDGSIVETPEPSKQEILKQRVIDFEKNKNQKKDTLKNYRIVELYNSDWTILPDSPIPVGIQSSWKEYRQKLRDLPDHKNAPDRFLISDWPLSPDQTNIPEEAKIYIAEISDPLGIGTTSWVGITTTGEYYEQEMPSPTNLIGIGSTDVGIGTTTT